MIAAITDVRLARSGSAAESRKYWKKHGKKINARKRQRRKSAVMNTTYTSGDYKWVKDIINQHQKKGISRRELWRISHEQPKPKHGLRSELSPGREKISQIVTDGDGTDWKVTKSVGGRGKPTVIRPLQPDEIVAIERLGYGICYRTIVERLKSFRKMGNVFTQERFKRNDFFLYATLKDEMLGFPMKIFLTRGRSGSDKSSIFNAVVSNIQTHLKTMRKIEDDQKALNRKFPQMLKYVETLRARNVEELVFKISKKDNPKNIVPETNALRSYFASF